MSDEICSLGEIPFSKDEMVAIVDDDYVNNVY